VLKVEAGNDLELTKPRAAEAIPAAETIPGPAAELVPEVELVKVHGSKSLPVKESSGSNWARPALRLGENPSQKKPPNL